MANATVDGAKQFFSSYARSLLAKVDVSLPSRTAGKSSSATCRRALSAS